MTADEFLKTEPKQWLMVPVATRKSNDQWVYTKEAVFVERKSNGKDPEMGSGDYYGFWYRRPSRLGLLFYHYGAFQFLLQDRIERIKFTVA